eukprot:119954_1
MEEAVLFRSMLESLSTSDFNQFCTRLFDTFNQRDLLTKSIFHLLSYQNRNALTTQYTQNINKILINIMDSTTDENNENSIKNLIETHTKVTTLENEVKKHRVSLIKEYKNRNSGDSDWHILRIRYTKCAQQLQNEAAKFHQLFTELDRETNTIECPSKHEHNKLNNNNNGPTILDLSYPLIASCGSYLQFSELFNFQLLNRHIYISCKINPLSLTQLLECHKDRQIGEESWYHYYTNSNFGNINARNRQLNRFSMVRDLRLTCSDFDIITNGNKNPDNFVWRNIRQLQIKVDAYRSIEENEWLCKYSDILKPLEYLQYLSLETNQIIPQHLFQLISINPNIRFVHLIYHGGMIRLGDEYDETMNKYEFLLSKVNLHGLNMTNDIDDNDTHVVFFNWLLSNFCPQLRSYHVEFGTSSNFNRDSRSLWNEFGSNYMFINLKELCIELRPDWLNNNESCYTSLALLSNALSTCNLERLSIKTGCRVSDVEYEMYSGFITEILQSQMHLIYLSFCGDDGIALETVNRYIKNEMKNINVSIFDSIKFVFKPTSIYGHNWNTGGWTVNNIIGEKIERDLFELIHILNKAVCGSFLIKFKLPWRPKNMQDQSMAVIDETPWLRCIQKLEDLKDKFDVDVSPNRFHIVKTKNVQLYGGYHEQWIMECAKCDQYSKSIFDIA